MADAAANPQAHGKTYNVAGDEILTLAEWLGLLSVAAGVAPPFVLQVRFGDLRRLVGFDYRLPLPTRPLLDTSAARRDLGFRSTAPAEWLPGTVDWWRGSGFLSRFWERRSQEIETIRSARQRLGLQTRGADEGGSGNREKCPTNGRP